MAKIKGVCKNIDDCSKAENREEQEVEKSVPFVCEECGKPLTPIKSGNKGGGSTSKLPIIIIAAVLIIGAGVGSYLFLSNPPVIGANDPVDSVSVDTISPIISKTLSLSQTNLILVEGDAIVLQPTITPQDATASYSWTSDNSEVAKVNEGTVSAIKEGEAVITVTLASNPEVKIDCAVKVTPKIDGGKNTGLDLDYAKWSGKKVGGKAEGSGTMTFKKSHLIDARDPKQRIAQPGEYVTGEYSNGKLVQGRWFRSNGESESIIIGK